MLKNLFYVSICSILFVFNCVTGNISAYEPVQYKITDVGTLESHKSEAFWINDSGEVLGKYTFNGKSHIFVWSKDKGICLLDKIPEKANLLKLNNNGQILCFTEDGNNSNLKFHLWDPSKGLITLLNNNSNECFIACDVTDDGIVVGCISKNGKNIPVIWNKGNVIELEHLAGDLGILSNNTIPRFINNNMDIVGISQKATVHKGNIVGLKSVAVAWQASKNWCIKELFPESIESSYPMGINDAGMIFCHKGNSGKPGKGILVDIKDNKILMTTCGSTGAISLMNNNFFVGGGRGVCQFVKEGCDNYLVKCTPLIKFLPIEDSKDKFWDELKEIKSVNSSGFAVGNAQTVFNETHVILFEPIVNN